MKYFISLLSLSVLGVSSISIAETESRVPDECAALIFAKVDKGLPKNEFISKMSINPESPTTVDLELTQDMGKGNLCLKAGSVEIEFDPYGNQDFNTCRVIKVNIESKEHYDCG